MADVTRRVTVLELARALDVPPSLIMMRARRLGSHAAQNSDALDPQIVAAILNADPRVMPTPLPELPGRREALLDGNGDTDSPHRPFRPRRRRSPKTVLPADLNSRVIDRLAALEKRLRAEIVHRLPLPADALDAVLLARTGRRPAVTTDSLGRMDDVAELLDVASAVGIDTSEIANALQETTAILDIRRPEVLYERAESLIVVPRAIVAVSDSLLALLAREPKLLYEVTPRRFEEVIAELFKREGFEVEVTKQTRDGGKDIIAVSQRMNVLTKYVIECKRYSAHRKVDLSLVQRLLGVKIANSANKAILATTSTYTSDARVFASDHFWDIDLKDINDITKWLSPYA